MWNSWGYSWNGTCHILMWYHDTWNKINKMKPWLGSNISRCKLYGYLSCPAFLYSLRGWSSYPMDLAALLHWRYVHWQKLSQNSRKDSQNIKIRENVFSRVREMKKRQSRVNNYKTKSTNEHDISRLSFGKFSASFFQTIQSQHLQNKKHKWTWHIQIIFWEILSEFFFSDNPESTPTKQKEQMNITYPDYLLGKFSVRFFFQTILGEIENQSKTLRTKILGKSVGKRKLLVIFKNNFVSAMYYHLSCT